MLFQNIFGRKATSFLRIKKAFRDETIFKHFLANSLKRHPAKNIMTNKNTILGIKIMFFKNRRSQFLK